MDDKTSESDLALLGAYIDQELNANDRKALQERLLQEPALRAKLDELQQLDADLKGLLQAAGQQEVPGNIQALLADNPTPSKNYRWPLSIAAGVLLVVTSFWFSQQQSPVNNNWQQIAKYFDSSPSMEKQQVQQLEFIAVRSFQHQRGQYCREYYLQTNETQEHGIACKQQGEWQKVVSQQQPTFQEHYQTASGENVDLVAAYFKRHKKNGTLSQDDEKELLKQKWLPE